MRLFAYIITTLAVTLSITACDHYDAPTSTRSAFQEQYPSAVDVEWEKKRGYAVAEFHIPGQGECEAAPGAGCILELRGHALVSVPPGLLTDPGRYFLVLSSPPFLPTLLLKKMFQRFCQ